MTTPSTLPTSRFALLLPYLGCFLIVSTALRSLLLVTQHADLNLAPLPLMSIYAIGLVYDLAFFAYLSIPFVLLLLLVPEKLLHSRALRITVFVATAGFFFFLFFTATAEWLFWDEFGVRFNFIAVDYLIYRREVTDNILQSYPIYRLIGGMLLASLLGMALLRPTIDSALSVYEPFRHRLRYALPLLLAPLVAIGLGQSLHDFSSNRFQNELAANGPYQFVAAFRNNSMDYRQFYHLGENKEVSARLRTMLAEPGSHYVNNDLFDITRDIQGRGKEQRLNVVLLTVESLSADYLSSYGNTRQITPVLDRLAKESLVFDHFYATGTRTVRGLEALTLSLPPTPGRSLVKRPDNARVFSLGKVFTDQGYDPVFFYGGYGYFDNMNDFYAGNGYRVVDRTDFSADDISFENAWGVADGDLLRRVITEADQETAAGQPFFFQVMTTSNHRPYTYPENAIDIPSGSGRNGAVKYTDYAIGQFLAEARNHAWFKNTLFVIVADHCSGSAGRDALPVEKYRIPLFIYAPGHVTSGVNHLLSSQIDVAPTILGLLNFSYRSQFFGHDLLAPGVTGRALIGNYQRLGLLDEDQLAYLSPQGKVTVVDHPLGVERLEPESEALLQPLTRDTMAYYQGADYMISHRINRWSDALAAQHTVSF